MQIEESFVGVIYYPLVFVLITGPSILHWMMYSGFSPFFHPVIFLSAYTASVSMISEYLKSGDCCEGMIVNLSTSSITSARMFVAVGWGDRCGSAPRTVSESLYVTSGADMVHGGCS